MSIGGGDGARDDGAGRQRSEPAGEGTEWSPSFGETPAEQRGQPRGDGPIEDRVADTLRRLDVRALGSALVTVVAAIAFASFTWDFGGMFRLVPLIMVVTGLVSVVKVVLNSRRRR